MPKRKRAPPDGPQRALTSYQCYIKANRKRVADDWDAKGQALGIDPVTGVAETKFGIVSKLLGQEWKALADKSAYARMSQDDRDEKQRVWLEQEAAKKKPVPRDDSSDSDYSDYSDYSADDRVDLSISDDEGPAPTKSKPVKSKASVLHLPWKKRPKKKIRLPNDTEVRIKAIQAEADEDLERKTKTLTAEFEQKMREAEQRKQDEYTERINLLRDEYTGRINLLLEEIGDYQQQADAQEANKRATLKSITILLEISADFEPNGSGDDPIPFRDFSLVFDQEHLMTADVTEAVYDGFRLSEKGQAKLKARKLAEAQKRLPPLALNDTDAKPNERMCAICLNNAASTVLAPCGHSAMCFSCSHQMFIDRRTNDFGGKCPICNMAVDFVIPLFVSGSTGEECPTGTHEVDG